MTHPIHRSGESVHMVHESMSPAASLLLQSKHLSTTLPESTDLHPSLPRKRRGKALPIDSFDGESPDVLFEDWVPALQRVTGPGTTQRPKQAVTKQVQTAGASHTPNLTLSHFLSSDSELEDSEIGQIRIDDQGSQQQYVDVLIEGVIARGVVDSGCRDHHHQWKIVWKDSCCCAAEESTEACRRVPRTYDRKTSTLDGRLDLDICFDGVTMRNPIYVKLDAADQLLLGEGVCRQLKIISYHPSVLGKRSRRRNEDKSKRITSTDGAEEHMETACTKKVAKQRADPSGGGRGPEFRELSMSTTADTAEESQERSKEMVGDKLTTGQQHRRTQSCSGTFAGKSQDRQPANIRQDWWCGTYPDRSGSLRDGGLGQDSLAGPGHGQQPSRAETEGPSSCQ